MTTNVQTSSILAEIGAEHLYQGTAQGCIALLSDDEGKLAMAAAAFSVQSTGASSGASILWPSSSLMPVCESRRHCLIVAGALIVAEVKRIDGILNIERQATGSFADIVEHFQETGGLVELGFATPPQEELTAEFTRALPGGVMDDSTFSAVEDALDRAGAPSTENGRWLTLTERIDTLAALIGPNGAIA